MNKTVQEKNTVDEAKNKDGFARYNVLCNGILGTPKENACYIAASTTECAED